MIAALARVTAWLDARMIAAIGEKSNHWAVLRELLSETGTAGNLTTDAHLAATLGEFTGTVRQFAEGGSRGLNVTVPHN